MRTFLVRLKGKANLFKPTFEHELLEREFNSVLEASAVLSLTVKEPFFLIDANYSIKELPKDLDKRPGLHAWCLSNTDNSKYGGLWLSVNQEVHNTIDYFNYSPNILLKKLPIFDVFRLVYDELEYETNFKTVVLTSTIWDNHKTLSSMSKTENFFVLDADLRLTDDSFLTDVEDDPTYVNLWYVQNPFNRLAYGHGGPKFFHKKFFEAATPPDGDMTMSFPIKIQNKNVGVHQYNWSAFSTWRTAFREAFKLTRQTDEESKERLLTWLDVSDYNVEFSNDNAAGALAGHKLAKTDLRISKLNDYQFLERLFLNEN